MLAVFATMALPNGNLEHMFYVRIMGEFVGGMLLCLAWVRGGARLGGLVVVLPATLVVLALVPAAAAGHYWAAPALGLGVAALAGSSGWVTAALSWPGLVAAGEASYALYMTHLLVQPFVHSLRLWAQGSGWASAWWSEGSWSCSPRWPGSCTPRSSGRPGVGSRRPAAWSPGRRARAGVVRCDHPAERARWIVRSVRLERDAQNGLRDTAAAIR